MAQHLWAGREAERIARQYLKDNGLCPIAANYRCRRGELDLVMREGSHIVFIEIRYRRSARPVAPVETINRGKRRRIAAAAAHFLQQNAIYGDNPVRFDVVGMSGPLQGPSIEWLRNAFSTDDI